MLNLRFAAAAFCLLLPSCATMLAPGPDLVPVTSEPTATVLLDGAVVGTTPTKVSIPRSAVGVLTLRAEGFLDEKVTLEKKVNGVAWCNLLLGLGAIPGCLIDIATGNYYRFPTEPVHARLQPHLASASK